MTPAVLSIDHETDYLIYYDTPRIGGAPTGNRTGKTINNKYQKEQDNFRTWSAKHLGEILKIKDETII